MLISLFNKKINTKDYHCSVNNNEPEQVEKPYTNIYVRMTNNCNANCSFCSFNSHSCTKKFDYKKFVSCINEIQKNVYINKVSFTGGEPTLNIKLLNKCISFIKSKTNAFIVVNTNGFNIKELVKNSDIDSISLSRHHYNDDKNNSLFNSKQIISNNDLNELENKNKLHLSCNIIKNNIDTNIECYNYINYYCNIGIKDFGFVSLMKNNKFSINNHLDFDNIKLEEMQCSIINKQYNNSNSCKCKNMLVTTSNGNMCTVYFRYYINSSCNNTVLVYDIDTLKEGFNGQQIC